MVSYSTREGLTLTSQSRSVVSIEAPSFPHSRTLAQFCSVGLNVLKDRSPEGMKEPQTGFSFPGELCFQSGQTHCPRLTGVGYVGIFCVSDPSSWSIYLCVCVCMYIYMQVT